MKKKIIMLSLLFCASANAEVENNGIDQYLYDEKIIDINNVILDKDRFQKYFNDVSIEYKQYLPIEVESGFWIVSMGYDNGVFNHTSKIDTSLFKLYGANTSDDDLKKMFLETSCRDTAFNGKTARTNGGFSGEYNLIFVNEKVNRKIIISTFDCDKFNK